jgi:hypothetical protein
MMTTAWRVIPAQAGIQSLTECWISAFTGMTVKALMIGHDFVKIQ